MKNKMLIVDNIFFILLKLERKQGHKAARSLLESSDVWKSSIFQLSGDLSVQVRSEIVVG